MQLPDLPPASPSSTAATRTDLDRHILGILQLFPRGLDDKTLRWRLMRAGVRWQAEDMLAALTRLTRSGLVQRTGGRWHAAELRARVGQSSAMKTGAVAAEEADIPEMLRAVPGRTTEARESPVSFEEVPPAGRENRLPDARALLSYYASTQRLDPRGQVIRYADEHAEKWQLFTTAGEWWTEARIEVEAAHLPGGFRSALAREGREGFAALGWPVHARADGGQTMFAPALLVPVRWELSDRQLIVSVANAMPVVNPEWARIIRRMLRLTRADLEAALLDGFDEEPDLAAIGTRLSHLAAPLIRTPLRPGELVSELPPAREGLHNAAALFLPDDGAFTRGAARDLETLATWDEGALAGTALSDFFRKRSEAAMAAAPPLLALDNPTDSQYAAALAALAGPVVAIQGPPGTGKSATIVNLVISILAAGGSVLVASRNHRALDELEIRLGKRFPDLPLVIRGRDAEGERDVSFLDALRELANAPERDPMSDAAAERAREKLHEAARRREVRFRRERERERLALLLSEFTERIQRLEEAGASSSARRGASFLVGSPIAAFIRLFVRLFSRRSGRDLPDHLPEGVRLAELLALRHRIVRRYRELVDEEGAEGEEDSIETNALCTIFQARLAPDATARERLRQREREIEFSPRRASVRDLSAEDARLILRHRPVWAVTALAVPARLPLVPGLFDYVIFDEASQCDIASALPLMARAKRAVIVGDPMQLTFVPRLGVAQEHALMDAAGLPAAGRALIAQSRNSLYDFHRNWHPNTSIHLLRDQFRSAPGIVDYVSRAFYGGRLIPRCTDEQFRLPKGYRPGLEWLHVAGTTRRNDEGNINEAEAEAILAQLQDLAQKSSFEGSVGVIAPFNAQVNLIRGLVERHLGVEITRRMELKIGTVDAWQGGEADVIFFSLVATADAPPGAIGFLERDRRRFNVGVSRARALTMLVGNREWARNSGIAHLEELVRHIEAPPNTSPRGFGSPWEKRLFDAMCARGLDPKPQYRVGRRFLDFALFAGDVKLDVEVDGRLWHAGAGGRRKTADRLRDRELMARGWKVRRFWVWELQENMKGCVDVIEQELGRGR